jgi:transcriptional regulator with XRE-family HTH domain
MEASTLRTIRKSKGLTQAQLAAGIGVSSNHVYMVESNRRPLTRVLELAAVCVLTHPTCVASSSRIQSSKSDNR